MQRCITYLLVHGKGRGAIVVPYHRRASFVTRRSFSGTVASSSSSSSRGGIIQPDPQQIKEDHQYCVNLVMERDREGYLCGLLVPSDARQSYFALRAFNVELASIKDGHRRQPNKEQTSLALQMRMQWWRDALNEIYQQGSDSNSSHTDENNDETQDSASTSKKQQQTKRFSGNSSSNLARYLSISAWQSPIVRSLARAHATSNLTRRFLERLVDARETDLHLHQYNTMEDVIQYAEESVASLLYLTLECTGVRNDAADQVAMHAGIAIGLTTALRATPFRLHHGGEVPLPASLFPQDFPYGELLSLIPSSTSSSNHRVESTPSETNGQIWNDAVRHMAHAATHHLVQVQQLQSQVPRPGKSALLPLVPATYYLDQLQKRNYNVFDPALQDQSRRFGLLLLLGRSWLTGVY